MTAARERSLAAIAFALLAAALLWRGVLGEGVPVCVDPLYRDAAAVSFPQFFDVLEGLQ